MSLITTLARLEAAESGRASPWRPSATGMCPHTRWCWYP